MLISLIFLPCFVISQHPRMTEYDSALEMAPFTIKEYIRAIEEKDVMLFQSLMHPKYEFINCGDSPIDSRTHWKNLMNTIGFETPISLSTEVNIDKLDYDIKTTFTIKSDVVRAEYQCEWNVVTLDDGSSRTQFHIRKETYTQCKTKPLTTAFIPNNLLIETIAEFLVSSFSQMEKQKYFDTKICPGFKMIACDGKEYGKEDLPRLTKRMEKNRFDRTIFQNAKLTEDGVLSFELNRKNVSLEEIVIDRNPGKYCFMSIKHSKCKRTEDPQKLAHNLIVKYYDAVWMRSSNRFSEVFSSPADFQDCEKDKDEYYPDALLHQKVSQPNYNLKETLMNRAEITNVLVNAENKLISFSVKFFHVTENDYETDEIDGKLKIVVEIENKCHFKYARDEESEKQIQTMRYAENLLANYISLIRSRGKNSDIVLDTITIYEMVGKHEDIKESRHRVPELYDQYPSNMPDMKVTHAQKNDNDTLTFIAEGGDLKYQYTTVFYTPPNVIETELRMKDYN